MVTSPPCARTALMTLATAVSEETAAVPSQVGVQPPPLGARMKANSKAFWPVAAMTVVRLGGLLSSGMTYGAEPYQLLPSVAASARCARPMLRIAAPAVALAVRATPHTLDRRTGSSLDRNS